MKHEECIIGAQIYSASRRMRIANSAAAAMTSSGLTGWLAAELFDVLSS